MAKSPECSALAAAMQKQGVTYAALAKSIGSTEQHVTEICTGSTRPSDEEFNSLSRALHIQNVPHTGVHATN